MGFFKKKRGGFIGESYMRIKKKTTPSKRQIFRERKAIIANKAFEERLNEREKQEVATAVYREKIRGERMRSKRSFAEQLFSSRTSKPTTSKPRTSKPTTSKRRSSKRRSSRRKQKKYNTGLGGGSLDLGLGDLF